MRTRLRLEIAGVRSEGHIETESGIWGVVLRSTLRQRAECGLVLGSTSRLRAEIPGSFWNSGARNAGRRSGTVSLGIPGLVLGSRLRLGNAGLRSPASFADANSSI